MVNIGFLGIFVLPMIPIGYSFSVELTYPVSEAMSNGFMIFLSQIIGSVLVIVATKLTAYHYEKEYCTLVFIGMMTVGLICTFFIKEDLRRVKAESRNNSFDTAENGGSRRSSIAWRNDTAAYKNPENDKPLLKAYHNYVDNKDNVPPGL